MNYEDFVNVYNIALELCNNSIDNEGNLHKAAND